MVFPQLFPTHLSRSLCHTWPLVVLPSPILRRVSSLRGATLCRSSPCSGVLRKVLPPGAGCAARAVGKAWPLAEGTCEELGQNAFWNSYPPNGGGFDLDQD